MSSDHSHARHQPTTAPGNDERAFLAAMQERPDDVTLRLIYADWLEEQGDPRGELLRLLHTLTQSIAVPDRDRLEDRLRGLLAAGVRPIGPFFTNSVGMRFARIPAGSFLMGSPAEEEGRYDDEARHPVTLKKGYYLGVHPVTQAVWGSVMGNHPSHFRGDDLPVEQVSWDDCHEFLQRLGERDGHKYRLPTEAEWEYACRAGTSTPFSFGKVCNGHQANCNGHYPYGTDETGPYLEQTSPVGSFPANAFGLHDMHGNVDEWCQDSYGAYADSATDPGGPDIEEYRVLRGGSWDYHPWFARAAYRDPDVRNDRAYDYGFRVVRVG